MMYSDNINDNDLGNLTWDSDKKYWTGETEIFPGQKVGILINPKGEDEKSVLENVRDKMKNIKDKNQEFKQKASDSLLNTYNKFWSNKKKVEKEGFIQKLKLFLFRILKKTLVEKDAEKMEKDEFIQKLRLSEISLTHNMGATLYYEAGDLFQGHAIEVRLDSDGNFSEATLAG